MATKIILDPGHGGYDNGASYNGRREKDDVLSLAFDVASELRRLGYEVEFTRVDDVYDSPNEKARIGNASGADYFISLHRNSNPTPNSSNGVQTLVYSDSGIKGQMARNINKRLEDVGFRNINVEERKNLAVLRRTKMPALLLEVGFINSDKDNQLFDENKARIAEAIAIGIDETLRGETVSTISQDRFYNPYHGYESSAPVFADESANAVTGDSRDNASANDYVDDTYDNSVIDGSVYAVYDNTPMNGNAYSVYDNSSTNGNGDSSYDDTSLSDDENETIYQILVGLFRNYGLASYKMNQLTNSGFDATANEVDGLYQVRVGAFDTIEDALLVQNELRKRGYESLIVRYDDLLDDLE